MSRDIGNLGESVFESLCHSLGITPNRVQIDKTGWDFLLEFPQIQDPNVSLDLSPPCIKCYVQIKSSDVDAKGHQIKMTNLKRFLEIDEPAFFVFMNFSHQDNVKSIYLIHFGKEFIGRTLKKLRKLEVQGRPNLNKRKILVKRREAQSIGSPNSKALEQAIRSYIPNGIGKYREEKRSLIKTLGYESQGGHADILFKADNLDELIESSLQDRYELPVENFKLWDDRFGISIERKDMFNAAKRLILQRDNSIEHDISFTSKNKRVWFKAKVYTSPFDVADKVTRVRISNDFLEIKFFFDKNKVQILPLTNSTKNVSPVLLKSLGLLIDILHSQQKYSFKIHEDPPFEIDLSSDPSTIEEDLVEFKNACLALEDILSYFQLPNDLKSSPSLVYKDRKKVNNVFNYLVSGTYGLTIEIATKSTFEENSRVGMAQFLYVNIAGISIGCILKIRGTGTHHKQNEIRILSDHIEIVEPECFQKNESSEERVILNVTRVEKELEKEGLVVIKTDKNYLKFT